MEPLPLQAIERLSLDQLRAVYRLGETAVLDLMQAMQSQIQQLQARVQALEDRLAQNSSNSHKPPSSEGLAKPSVPKSLRTKTGRPSGGQPGHPGRTLQQVARPDRKIVHPLRQCPCGQCGGRSLRHQPVLEYEKRQVFELPELRLIVTEHQAEVKVCPMSGQVVRAAFPAEVKAPTQYGPGFYGLMVYLHQHQHLPSERLTQFCEDLFGQPLSEATLQAATERTYGHLAGFEHQVREQLVKAPAVNVDESGLRVEAQLHWLHVASTSQWTHYGVHPQRGTVAMEALGIIPRCRGWLIHDHWAPYFTYEDCVHALCNQHLLRELKFLAEEHQEGWAQQLSQLLVRSHRRQQEQGPFTPSQFRYVLGRYRQLVRQGRQRHPGVPKGRQSKAANLVDRLEGYDLCYLAFLFDPDVPFTNNQAEQDIRMIKVRQKISGGFRTLKGAQIFARIRSYFSTCRKQGHNLWAAAKEIGRAHV
jgi:transposase